MRWLLITDTSELELKINESLLQNDKNNILITIDSNPDEIKKQINSIEEFAGCFIYSQDSNKLLEEKKYLLSNFSNVLLAKEIPILTNINFLKEQALILPEFISVVQNEDEILKTISKSYKQFTADSIQRLAKTSLLKKGIPFTSDCFASYIAKNKEEIINKFLEAGMGVNVRDDLGTPMLNIACRNDNFEIAEMLLNLGAELNAVSEDRGYTAVMDAIWRGNEKITRFLIEKGADLNTINKEGQSNLILAVGADRLNLVKLLAENGADPDVKDMMGMSAYNYATLFRKEKIVEILKPYHKEI